MLMRISNGKSESECINDLASHLGNTVRILGSMYTGLGYIPVPRFC